MLCRTDDNGVTSLVARGLMLSEARERASCLEASAHKQHYSIIERPAGMTLPEALLALGIQG